MKDLGELLFDIQEKLNKIRFYDQEIETKIQNRDKNCTEKDINI